MDPHGMGNRTYCKPRANNRLFGVKTGLSGDAVDAGNPFMMAGRDWDHLNLIIPTYFELIRYSASPDDGYRDHIS